MISFVTLDLICVIKSNPSKISFNSKTIFLDPINTIEVIKTIANLKNKSGGVDTISVLNHYKRCPLT